METPEPEVSEHPNVAGPVVVLGFALMVEAILIFIVSVPLVLFAGIGVLGLIGGGALSWAGWLLAGLSVGNYKAAGIVTAIAGIGVAVFSALAFAMASCASFVNCGPSPSYIGLVVWVVLLSGFNLLCAALLWRRAARA
jgi:hypothetical protein